MVIIKILILTLAVSSCFDGIGREIKQELISPSGSHKIIVQSVDGGTATKHLNRVFVLRWDLKIRRDSTSVLTTTDGNILNIYWKDNRNIFIKVKSEALIEYQVVKCYGFTIVVEVDDAEVP
jgi:hypothetical protein